MRHIFFWNGIFWPPNSHSKDTLFTFAPFSRKSSTMDPFMNQKTVSMTFFTDRYTQNVLFTGELVFPFHRLFFWLVLIVANTCFAYAGIWRKQLKPNTRLNNRDISDKYTITLRNKFNALQEISEILILNDEIWELCQCPYRSISRMHANQEFRVRYK